jgi:Rap1a immunity proteins
MVLAQTSVPLTMVELFGAFSYIDISKAASLRAGGAMRLLIAFWTLLGAAIPIAAASQSNEMYSAISILPYCRAYIDGMPLNESSNGLKQGLCAGIVAGIMATGQAYDANNRFCAPSDADVRRAISVVINGLQERPEMMRGDFRILALLALHRAWPCR